MRKYILLLSLLPVFAQADFKELEKSDIDFITNMISKNSKDCLSKNKINELHSVKVTNKTSQHIDKDSLSNNVAKALTQEASIVLTPTTAPTFEIVLNSKISEKPTSFESTYEITFHVSKDDKTKICENRLTLSKSLRTGP